MRLRLSALRDVLWLGGRLANLTAAVLLIRLLSHLPLPNRPPGLETLFHGDAFLALLDVFAGGAVARFSVLALGLYPYLLAGLVSPQIVRGDFSIGADRERLAMATATLAAALCLPLGVAYFALLQRLGIPLMVVPLASAAQLAAMAAGSLLLLWLAQRLADDFGKPGLGVGLILATNALAAAPGYLLVGQASPLEVALRLGLFLALAAVYLMMSQGERRIRVMNPMSVRSRPAKLARDSSYIPIPMSWIGLRPLMILLALLGAAHLSGVVFASSTVPWLRQAASLEAGLADPAGQTFWIILGVLGLVVSFAFAQAQFDQLNLAETLKRSKSFVLDLRPGTETHSFLKRVFQQIGLVGSFCTVALVTVPGLLGTALGHASPWPIMLVPTLYVVGPIIDLVRTLEAQLISRSYSGFFRK
jgi:preprotein translocase subunit SecY